MKLPCEKYTPLFLGELTLADIIQVVVCVAFVSTDFGLRVAFPVTAFFGILFLFELLRRGKVKRTGCYWCGCGEERVGYIVINGKDDDEDDWGDGRMEP